MERLGIYLFLFLFLGLTLLERVRTQGYSGSLREIFWRNSGLLAFAMAVHVFWGRTIIGKGFGGHWIEDARELVTAFSSGGALFYPLALQSLFAAGATLIVGAGIWELHLSRWRKLCAVALFCLVVHPVFGWAQSGEGILGEAGYHDYRGALHHWALPASFLLGLRLVLPERLLPGQRDYQLRGGSFLPGLKRRFFLSRGIGLTTVFLILNASVLEGYSWFISKTITLLPASFAVLFSQLIFFAIWGKNAEARRACAPPILAILAAFVGTQACHRHPLWAAALAGAVTAFAAMIYLRRGPLGVRFWDPVCSVPVFLLGGIAGSLFAALSCDASPLSQALGVVACLAFGGATGAALGAINSAEPPQT